MNCFVKSLITFCLITSSLIMTADHSPLDHAPIGVMGDHTHKKGEWMMSLRLMHMQMEGMRSGTTSLEDSAYPQMIKPQDMDMNMYMLGLMYAPTDKLTLSLMMNYMQKSMNLRNQMMGVDFETESNSIQDTWLGFLFNAHKDDNLNLFGIFQLAFLLEKQIKEIQFQLWEMFSFLILCKTVQEQWVLN